jgi:hypothetical protein
VQNQRRAARGERGDGVFGFAFRQAQPAAKGGLRGRGEPGLCITRQTIVAFAGHVRLQIQQFVDFSLLIDVNEARAV